MQVQLCPAQVRRAQQLAFKLGEIGHRVEEERLSDVLVGALVLVERFHGEFEECLGFGLLLVSICCLNCKPVQSLSGCIVLLLLLC